MYRFDLVLCLLTNLFSFRGEIGPSSEGGARWTSGGGGDSQAPLQLQSTTCKGGVTVVFHLLPSLVEGGCMESSWWDPIWSSSIQLSLLGLYN